MKFLKSVTLFPVKLVGYPMLAVVSVVHGALALLWEIVTNIHHVTFAAFTPWPVARMATAKLGPKDDHSMYYFPAILYSAILFFGGSMAVGLVYQHASMTSLATKLPVQAFAVLLATNLLSGLYEGGRAYYNYLTGAKTPSQTEEVPEAKIIAPQGYLTMLDKIQGKDRWSEEEAWTLVQESAGVRATDKAMKLGDMHHLVKAIVDRSPSRAVVH